MSAAIRIILAPIIWASGAVRTTLAPFYWIAKSDLRISTWISRPATAFSLRRITMALAVATLLAFWLTTRSAPAEPAPITTLNTKLAMWQIGATLGQPDLLAVLIMALALVVSLARFAGDDLLQRLWLIVTLILTTLLLVLADAPLILPAAIGLIGLAGSNTFSRTRTQVALTVPLIMSSTLLGLGVAVLATSPVDPGLMIYLTPSEAIAKLLIMGTLLVSTFAIPGMAGRLSGDMEGERGGRIAILIALSIANGYMANATSALDGTAAPVLRLLFGLLLLVSLIQTLRRAWLAPTGSGHIAHYWTLSQILLLSAVLAGVSVPGEWYVLYGEIAGLSVLLLYCWSGHSGERSSIPKTTVGLLVMVTGWLAVLGTPSTAVFNVRWLMAAGLPSAEAQFYLIWIASLFLAGGGQVMVAGRVLRGGAALAKPAEGGLQPDQPMVKFTAYASASLLIVWAVQSVGFHGAGTIDLSSPPSATLGIWAYLVTAAGFLLGLYLTVRVEDNPGTRQVTNGTVSSALWSILHFFDCLDFWGWTATIMSYLANWIRWLLYITLLRPPKTTRTGGD